MAFVKLPVSVKVSFPLEKCLKKFQEEDIIAKTARDGLIKKYGEVIFDKDGQVEGWSIDKAPKDRQEQFRSEISELANIEFDIPIESKLSMKISDFGDSKISSEHITKMRLLIDFVE